MDSFFMNDTVFTDLEDFTRDDIHVFLKYFHFKILLFHFWKPIKKLLFQQSDSTYQLKKNLHVKVCSVTGTQLFQSF